MYGPKVNDAPSTGSWIKAQRVDLAAWQAFYHGSNNWFKSRSGPPTNYFPVAKEPQTPAADVLLALSKFNENRQVLIAASARPHARFWINYDAGFALPVSHLPRIKATAQYLSLHATAALKAGDRETALEDIKLLFRSIEAIRGEPILISQLVRIAMVHIALQPVWEGLADRQWTDAELSTIESELSTLDFLADYRFAIRGERACSLWWLDSIRKAGISGLDEMVALSSAPGPADLEQFLGRATSRLIPAGWFNQNKLSLCRMYEKYLLLLAGDQNRRVVSPAAIQQANLELSIGKPGGLTTFSRGYCCLPWLASSKRAPAPKAPLTSPASPARWSDTGWRMASSRIRSTRSPPSSSRSCRTTSSTASRSSIAAPTMASLSSTRSGRTKPMTAERSD